MGFGNIAYYLKRGRKEQKQSKASRSAPYLFLAALDGFPELFVDTGSQTRHHRKLQILLPSPQRVMERGVTGKRFRLVTVHAEDSRLLTRGWYLCSTTLSRRRLYGNRNQERSGVLHG